MKKGENDMEKRMRKNHQKKKRKIVEKRWRKMEKKAKTR